MSKDMQSKVLPEETLRGKIKEALQIKKAIDILKDFSDPLVQQIKDHFQALGTEGGTQLTEYDSEYGGFTYVESDNSKPDPDKIKSVLGDAAYKAVTEKKTVVNKEKLKAYLLMNKVSEAKLRKAGLKDAKTPSLRPDFNRVPFDILAHSSQPTQKDIIGGLVKVITMMDNRTTVAPADDRSHTAAYEHITNAMDND